MYIVKFKNNKCYVFSGTMLFFPIAGFFYCVLIFGLFFQHHAFYNDPWVILLLNETTNDFTATELRPFHLFT